MQNAFIRHKIPLVINVTAFYTFHYHEYSPSFVFKGESHNFWELVYIDSGTVFFSRNHKTEELATSGQCIFHQPNEFHTIRANKSIQANVFIITFECKSCAMQFFKEKIFTLSSANKIMLKNLFNTVSQNFQLEGTPSQIIPKDNKTEAFQLVKLNLELFLLSLTERNHTVASINPVSMDTTQDEIVEFLRYNIYTKLKLSDICNVFHYQKSAICKQFKEKNGRTIFEYINYLRIEESKKLIKNSKDSFVKISQDLNFRSYSNFVQTFKKLTKLTPSEYKESLI